MKTNDHQRSFVTMNTPQIEPATGHTAQSFSVTPRPTNPNDDACNSRIANNTPKPLTPDWLIKR